MIRVGREVEYGLIALKVLGEAKPEDPVSVRSICDAYSIPFDATSRVLQKLKHEGVVASTQGVRGGYYLVKSLHEVSFLSMLEAIGVPTHVAGCLSVACDCAIESVCNIRGPMAVLDQRLQAFYQNMTLGELLGLSAPAGDVDERIPEAVGKVS